MDNLTKPVRVLLVYPNIWSDVFPLSLLILSAVLKQNGVCVEVFSAVHRRKSNSPPGTVDKEGPDPLAPEQFQQSIDRFQPDVIAFSTVEDAFPLTCQLLDGIAGYKGFVIVGGVFPTFAPSKVMSHPRVDALCIGEGEKPLSELCRRLAHNKPITTVPGFWVKDTEGGICKNPPDSVVVLDKLPPPDYSILDRQSFPGPIPIITHRGCPYPCTFCNSPAQAALSQQGGQTAYFRKQSMTTLARELKLLTTQHSSMINRAGLYFCSDTLLAWSDKEFHAFIELYSDYKIPFVCHSTPETITEERMQKLVEVGLRLMNIGVQHGNEQFRRDVLKRRMPNDELIKRFEIASSQGAFISADFIMGFPLETPALAQDSISLAQQIKAYAKNCSLFVPYHGTALRTLAIEKGFLAEDELARWNPARSQLNMPLFPPEQITRMVELFHEEKQRPVSCSDNASLQSLSDQAQIEKRTAPG